MKLFLPPFPDLLALLLVQARPSGLEGWECGVGPGSAPGMCDSSVEDHRGLTLVGLTWSI